MMLQEAYDTLIIGTTGFAMGAALSVEAGQVLIVEPSACMASEWTETFYPGTQWANFAERQAQSAVAQSLQAELEQRQIKTQRGVSTPGIAALLFKSARDAQLPISFMTRVLGVQETSDGFDVQVVNAGGLYTIRAQRVIDTTDGFISDPQQRVSIVTAHAGIQLRANPKTDVQNEAHSNSDYEFMCGAFETEASVHLPLAQDLAWPAVRKQVHDFLMNRPDALQGWNCTAIATRPRLAVQTLDTGNAAWTHQPAAPYANVIAAVDAGALLAQEQIQGVLA